jgi:hypothetical protein
MMRKICLRNHFNTNETENNSAVEKSLKPKGAFHYQICLFLRVTEGSNFQEIVDTSMFITKCWLSLSTLFCSQECCRFSNSGS